MNRQQVVLRTNDGRLLGIAELEPGVGLIDVFRAQQGARLQIQPAQPAAVGGVQQDGQNENKTRRRT